MVAREFLKIRRLIKLYHIIFKAVDGVLNELLTVSDNFEFSIETVLNFIDLQVEAGVHLFYLFMDFVELVRIFKLMNIHGKSLQVFSQGILISKLVFFQNLDPAHEIVDIVVLLAELVQLGKDLDEKCFHPIELKAIEVEYFVNIRRL